MNVVKQCKYLIKIHQMVEATYFLSAILGQFNLKRSFPERYGNQSNYAMDL